MAKKKTAAQKKVSRKKSAPRPKAQKRLSALDAAERVLAETGTPLTSKELIEAMREKGYWTSPAGRTPASTLYAAVTREIKLKGNQARFRKTGPGRFALKS